MKYLLMFYFPKTRFHKLLEKKGRYVHSQITDLHNPLKIAIKEKKGDCMSKKRVYEFAKELNVESKDILDNAKDLGIEYGSHMSSMSDDEMRKVKETLQPKSQSKPNQGNKNQKDQNKPQQHNKQ